MNTRVITSHQAPGAPGAVTVRASNDLTVGGAPKRYYLDLVGDDRSLAQTVIFFQDGALDVAGPNGVTHEALLAVVADRLARFQSGPYPCVENELALAAVDTALHWLHRRTEQRLARGVEGKHEA